jgi:hypothetical protein
MKNHVIIAMLVAMVLVSLVVASSLVSTALAKQAKVTTCHQNSENDHSQTTAAPSVDAHVRNQGSPVGPCL